MSRSYSPRTFLQDVPRDLLRRYVNAEIPELTVPWDTVAEDDVQPILDAWEALPQQKSQAMEGTFLQIQALATEEGIRIILEEADQAGHDLRESLETLDGMVPKVFWVRLEHPAIFNLAEMFSDTDQLNGRSWRKRKGLPERKPDTSEATCERLKQALTSFYWQKEGKSRRCEVRHFLRMGRLHYFYAFPEGHVTEFRSYSPDGKLERKTLAMASEVIFVVDPAAATLDLYAKGDKDLKEELSQIFCRAVFKEDLKGEETKNPAYDLNVLKRKTHAFPTDPQDGIEAVTVKKLRLSLIGKKEQRLTFEIGGRKQDTTVYALMEDFLHEEKVSLDIVNISQATLQVVFANGKPKKKTVTFSLTWPGTCSLKDKPEHHVIRTYLPRWKLENGNLPSGTVENA